MGPSRDIENVLMVCVSGVYDSALVLERVVGVHLKHIVAAHALQVRCRPVLAFSLFLQD